MKHFLNYREKQGFQLFFYKFRIARIFLEARKPIVQQDIIWISLTIPHFAKGEIHF